MNYRHAFHAGNFADVFKHAVLARIITYLQRKDAAFRVIDTHAGIGRYPLATGAAARTGEWLDGIGRLRGVDVAVAERAFLEPWLTVAMADMSGDAPIYPGSPLITRRLLRAQDRLTAIELHPDDVETLRALFAGDHQVRVIHLDGWLALGAHLPPKEKRGLVLVDPPFEQPEEFARLADGLARAWRRWPGGIYALWYPVKDRKAVARFREVLSASGIPDIIDAEVIVRDTGGQRLDGCGMAIINPPFVLEAELEAMLAFLAPRLALERVAKGWTIRRLAAERG